MATKDAMVAAARNVYGNLSNPLWVLPVQPSIATFPSTKRNVEPHGPKLSNHFGVGYEDLVLKKVQKVIAGSSIADGCKPYLLHHSSPHVVVQQVLAAIHYVGHSNHLAGPGSLLNQITGAYKASEACHGDSTEFKDKWWLSTSTLLLEIATFVVTGIFQQYIIVDLQRLLKFESRLIY